MACSINKAVDKNQLHVHGDFSGVVCLIPPGLPFQILCHENFKALVMPAPQDGADGCLSGHVIWL